MWNDTLRSLALLSARILAYWYLAPPTKVVSNKKLSAGWSVVTCPRVFFVHRIFSWSFRLFGLQPVATGRTSCGSIMMERLQIQFIIMVWESFILFEEAAYSLWSIRWPLIGWYCTHIIEVIILAAAPIWNAVEVVFIFFISLFTIISDLLNVLSVLFVAHCPEFELLLNVFEHEPWMYWNLCVASNATRWNPTQSVENKYSE